MNPPSPASQNPSAPAGTSQDDGISPAKPKLSFVERIAVHFLRTRNRREQPRIHRWAPEDLHGIQRHERTTILAGATSGVVSGTLIGLLEIWLSATMPDYAATLRGWLLYWAIFMGVSLLISGAEILFLYWLVLRQVARISTLAGLRLSDQEIEQVIALSLSRAALDMPDPRKPIYGVDPYARVPRWRLLAYAVLYRIKIGATSFIVRLILRRVLVRAALRALIPLVALVVYSVWNAIIFGWVMRASRIRVAGPLAVQELSARMRAQRHGFDDHARRTLLETVAEAIMRSGNHHPNFALLLGQLLEDFETPAESLQIDWLPHYAAIHDLAPEQQDLLLAAAAVATVIDGRPNRTQLQFMQEIHTACGRTFAPEALHALYRQFFDGQGIGELGIACERPTPADRQAA